jgi:hypothetical protein
MLRLQYKIALLSTSLLVAFAFALTADNPLHGEPHTHHIRPGDNPQAIVDQCAPGDHLVFLPGIHQHPLSKYQSILYVDKSLDIELRPNAVLMLNDNATDLLTTPEITIDHGAVKKLDDLSVSGQYDGQQGRAYFAIRIEKEGQANEPDLMQWSLLKSEPDVNRPFEHKGIRITGSTQELSNGIAIQFESTTGHSKNSLWILSVGGEPSYGIRVGHGKQTDYIENVSIRGSGTIDMNLQNNEQPTEWVKDISSAILLHGRVRNIRVQQLTMQNSMRTVMAYGEHTGRFLRGGGTVGGESFDAENIAITNTRSLNPLGKAVLLGHPSHRGRIRGVKCNFNYIITNGTALEPNFLLDDYEVIGNQIKSGSLAIHCWRRSTNGLIKDNVRFDASPNQEVVKVNHPSAWQASENLRIEGNSLRLLTTSEPN